jgi:hypothetical protein
MNLASAPGKAKGLGAGADKAAARLYNDVEQELALGSYSEDDADAGENALSILEERFPGVRTAARNVTDPPALSRSAKRQADGPGEDDRDDEDDSDERERGVDRAPRSSRSSSGRGRNAARSSRRSSSSSALFARATGGAGGNVSSAVILGLQGLLIAGLAYQVLQPKGAGALSDVLGAIEGGFQRIVQPVDPFSGLSATQQEGVDQVNSAITQANQTNPNVFDTPSGVQTYQAPTNLPGSGGSSVGSTPGEYDTPSGAVAPYKAPTNLPDPVKQAIARIAGGGATQVNSSVFPTPVYV